jgi:hypothetical protein
MNWLRRFIAGLFALAITVAIAAGTPWLLYRVAGNPLPKHMPSVDEIVVALNAPDNGDLFLRVLAVVGWIAWVTFTISVLIEIPAQLRGRRARRIPGMKVQQKIAAALVGSMIAVFAGASVAHAMVAAPVPAKSSIAKTVSVPQPRPYQQVCCPPSFRASSRCCRTRSPNSSAWRSSCSVWCWHCSCCSNPWA